jgi:CheY-like chemotaxis protein
VHPRGTVLQERVETSALPDEPPAIGSPAPVPGPVDDAFPVLVVDDHEAVRISVAQVLRSVGYRVMESGDGLDAAAMLSSTHFEAMVLDLRMPRLGGAALLQSLTQPPPTVVLSATEIADDELARLGDGVRAHLRKPVSPQRLIDAVRGAVQSGRDGPERAGA